MIKQIIRNLSRFLESSIMNVIGLTIALASSILILMQVKYELSYNKCHTDSERIYILERANSGPAVPRPFLNTIKASIPEVEYAALGNCYRKEPFIIINDSLGNKNSYKFRANDVTPDFYKVFGLQLIQGDTSVFNDRSKAIIPESFAKKISPDNSVIGRNIKIGYYSYTIGAVYKDFPSNTLIENPIYTLMNQYENVNNYNNYNYHLYLKLKKGTSAATVSENINTVLTGTPNVPESLTFSILPIKDIYYRYLSGSHTLNTLLISIAILILVVSAINFFNFATSLIPMRIKSVNIYKIFGSSVASLRVGIILEAVILSLLSLFLAVCVISLYQLSDLSSIISADLSFNANIDIYIIMFFSAIALGVFSALSPAIYITSIKPSILLSGNFALSAKGKTFRHLLVGVQFFASMALFAAAIFLNMQYKYILQKDLGFNTNQIAILKLNDMLADSRNMIKEKLLQNKDLSDVTFSMSQFGGNSNIPEWSMLMQDSKKGVTFSVHIVAYNFLDFMDIKVTNGRNFNINDEKESNRASIANQTAQNKYEFDRSDKIYGSTEIVGVCKDVIFESIKNKIVPAVFIAYNKSDSYKLNRMYVKINNNMTSSIDYIKQTLVDIDPLYPFEYQFYDKYFEQVYKKESNYRYLITQFSILAILISLIGVYGLVKFDTQFKRKEIAIRKINGATINDVMFMFCKTYLKIAVIGFLLSIPVVYYGISVWLQTFEYKTEIHWWVFPIVFVIEMIIIMTTVVIQSYKAATENPSNILN